jgi:hypothetical protein
MTGLSLYEEKAIFLSNDLLVSFLTACYSGPKTPKVAIYPSPLAVPHFSVAEGLLKATLKELKGWCHL